MPSEIDVHFGKVFLEETEAVCTEDDLRRIAFLVLSDGIDTHQSSDLSYLKRAEYRFAQSDNDYTLWFLDFRSSGYVEFVAATTASDPTLPIDSKLWNRRLATIASLVRRAHAAYSDSEIVRAVIDGVGLFG